MQSCSTSENITKFFFYLISYSRHSRPLFSQNHLRLQRVGNGPSNISQFGTQGYHGYASTSYPLPEYTTANPNRCPSNSNVAFGHYASTTTNHVDLSNNSRSTGEVTNRLGMKDERLSETVIEDGQCDQVSVTLCWSSNFLILFLFFFTKKYVLYVCIPQPISSKISLKLSIPSKLQFFFLNIRFIQKFRLL